jgi:tetratricopeptide (TPR) repeat protein
MLGSRTLPLALLLLAACGPTSAPAAPAGTPSAAPSAPAAVDKAAFDAARNKAVKLQDSGADNQEVLAALLAAHQLDPRHPGINRRLGQVYTDLRLNDQALAAYKAVLEVQPEDHEVLMNVVTIEVRLGQTDAALAALPPLRKDPAYAGEARYQEAQIADQQGRREDAEKLVADVADLSPPQAYHCRSLHGRYLTEAGDWQAAAAEFAAALAARPDYKEALRGAADCARRLGHEDEAKAWDERLELLVELTDNVYMRTPKQAAQRRAVLEKLVAAYPAWGGAFLELADLQKKSGDGDSACKTIDAYLAAHGSEVPADQHEPLRKRFCGTSP